MSGEFTEDTVAGDFFDAIDAHVVGEIGHGSGLRVYAWGGDEYDTDGAWPFVVVREGREFEIDIDVRVTELTPESKAAREAEAQRVLALLAQVKGAQQG